MKAGERNTLTVIGHAGYAPHGSDIVCAGVSAITFALIGYLSNRADDPCVSVENGEVLVSCNGEDNAFEMALTGYKQHSEKYPQYVEVHTAAQGG